MSTLRSNLIRLAHSKPELRPTLLPLLKTSSSKVQKAVDEIKAFAKKKGWKVRPRPKQGDLIEVDFTKSAGPGFPDEDQTSFSYWHGNGDAIAILEVYDQATLLYELDHSDLTVNKSKITPAGEKKIAEETPKALAVAKKLLSSR
jgi:hypothetical protein